MGPTAVGALQLSSTLLLASGLDVTVSRVRASHWQAPSQLSGVRTARGSKTHASTLRCHGCREAMILT
jgi:hypothetical protein